MVEGSLNPICFVIIGIRFRSWPRLRTPSVSRAEPTSLEFEGSPRSRPPARSSCHFKPQAVVGT